VKTSNPTEAIKIREEEMELKQKKFFKNYYI
jgi:hypothetical protein